MSNQPALFLDIDGVLNCHSSKSYCGIFVGIDKDKVQRLKKIVQKTNAIIILSSDWKIGWQPHRKYDPEIYPHAKYLDNHLRKKSDNTLFITDKTPNIRRSERGAEINAYLQLHPEITNYVVLDDYYFDDYDEYKIGPHLIWTNHVYGLTDDDSAAAISLLQGKFIPTYPYTF